MDSDAHVSTQVGNHQYVDSILKELDFPEELLLNDKRDEILKKINKKRGRL